MMKIEVVVRPTWDDLIHHSEKQLKELDVLRESIQSSLEHWKEMKRSGQPIPKEEEADIREIIGG